MEKIFQSAWMEIIRDFNILDELQSLKKVVTDIKRVWD